jgi:RNA polymerase sigma factor (sigma-70 family)
MSTKYFCISKIKRRLIIKLEEKIKLKKEITLGNNVEENRERLLLSCENLAKSIAIKFYQNNKHIPYEDLLQEAMIALDKSIMNWDEGKSSLSTVATYYMRNRLIDVINNSSYKIKFFSNMSKRNASYIKKIQSVENFTHKSIEELSRITGIKKVKIKNILHFCSSQRQDINNIHNYTEYSKSDNFPYCLQDLHEISRECLNKNELSVFQSWLNHIGSPQKNKLVSLDLGLDKGEVRDTIQRCKRKLKSYVRSRNVSQ